MIAFRARHPTLSREAFYTEQDVRWFDAAGGAPDWSGTDRTLGCVLHAANGQDMDLCLLFNAREVAVELRLPPTHARTHWRVAVDTAAPPPDDICTSGRGKPVPDPERHCVAAHSLVVLLADRR
jgi:isoamylase